MRSHDELRAIVLAAGAGSRLASLTRLIHGAPTPKQFASLHPDKLSMLQSAIRYIQPIVADDHISVVVPVANLAQARSQLVAFPAVALIGEPRNRGSAPSLLLPLERVVEEHPAADVLIVSAACVVRSPENLCRGILYAQEMLDFAPVTLLGTAATAAKSDMDWIVPGRAIREGIQSVADLVAGPREQFARLLLEKGALWHTHFIVAEASTLWRISERHLRAQTAAIREAVSAGSDEALSRAYDAIQPADFSRDVVGRQLGIAVADVTSSGFAHVESMVDALRAFPNLGAARDLAALEFGVPGVETPGKRASRELRIADRRISVVAP